MQKNYGMAKIVKKRKQKEIRNLTKLCSDYRKRAEDPNLFSNFCSNHPNLTAEETTVIKEIVSAASTKNKKARRYSEHWLLLCLLFHIRSPSGYNFLRNLNLLPLPTTKTVRNCLRLINTSCGFDLNFFELLKKKLEKKSPFQKHGVLFLDEIQVPETIAVNTTKLTYVGLVDFGDDIPEKTGRSINDKANHALVFMFHALGDQYTQPIGVFASKGPVDGMYYSY